MSDSNRNMFATLFILVAVMVFFLILIAIVGGVYGADGVRTVLSWFGYIAILTVILGVFAVIVLLVSWIFNMATRNIVNFQAADDRGEVERLRIIREGMRGDREYDKDVRRHALPVARMLAKPTPVEVAPVVSDSWYDEDDDVDAEYQVLE